MPEPDDVEIGILWDASYSEANGNVQGAMAALRALQQV